MRKIISLLLALLLAVSVCSCGQKESPSTGDEKQMEAPDQSGASGGTDSTGTAGLGDMDVDAGLFNVTITIPADFLDGGTTQEQLDQDAKEKGFKSVTLNADGSATYVMTKAQHRELMDGIRESIDSQLNEMAGSEDYPRFVSVEANDDYTQFKVVVSAEELGLAESISVLGFYLFGGMYHAFNGTEPGNINVQYVNEETGAVIQEANSSDMG